MHFAAQRRLATVLPLFLFCLSASAYSEGSSTPQKPCTIHSSKTGSYFDLNPLSLSPPELKDGEKVNKDDREKSWNSRGYDYGTNFTINICGSVIEDLDDVVGVSEERWQNVSAYYKQDGRVYSMGQESSSLVLRGSKLLLNYTGGSPCPSPSDAVPWKRKLLDDDDDDDYSDDKKEEGAVENKRRKSTLMSFLCDRDVGASRPKISFAGTMDECTYFFDITSAAACGGVAASPDDGLGPAGVFGVIVGIAVAVYLIGGCAYQRTVMHQRGWGQCPNAGLWLGIASFMRDMVISLFSTLCSCLSLDRLKSARGYTHLSNGRSGDRRGLVGAFGGRGTGNRPRRHDLDEENRLIDQLDEEWDE